MKSRYQLVVSNLAVCAVFLAASLSSATTLAAPQLVDLEPHWKAGDHIDYVLTKHGVVTNGVQVAVDTTNTTPIHIDVLKADGNSFVIDWIQGATNFDDAANASMNPLMKKMAGVMVGHKLELRLDRSARVQEVTNWMEVRDIGDAFVRDASTMLSQSGLDGARTMQATAQLRAMFSSEQSVRLVSTREAQLLLLSLGHTYDRSKPVQIEVDAPNPVGPGFVAATQRVEVRRGGGTDVALQWTQAATGAHVSGNADIDVITGWPAAVSQTVTAAADGAQRTETTSLQRK